MSQTTVEDVVTGRSRHVYDATCSALLTKADHALHALEDLPNCETKRLAVKAHAALHELSTRLVDNKIVVLKVA